MPGDFGIHVNVGCLGETQAGELGSRRSVGSVQDKLYRSREHLIIVIYLLAIDIHFQKHVYPLRLVVQLPTPSKNNLENAHDEFFGRPYRQQKRYPEGLPWQPPNGRCLANQTELYASRAPRHNCCQDQRSFRDAVAGGTKKSWKRRATGNCSSDWRKRARKLAGTDAGWRRKS